MDDLDLAVIAYLRALHGGDPAGQRAILSSVDALAFVARLGTFALAQIAVRGGDVEGFLLVQGDLALADLYSRDDDEDET